MTDREKVIKGLECCMSGQPDGLGCSRVPCPYKQFNDCEGILHRDAIALLKAQEPVRCAECKHCFDADRGTPYDGDEEWYCRRWERYVSAYAVDPYRFYCAAGERREIRVKDVVCRGDGYGTK